MSATIESDLNPDAPPFNPDNMKGEPRLIQPPARYEYNERTEFQNPQTMVRDSDQPQENYTFKQTTIQDNNNMDQPPAYTPGGAYRDRMDSLYSNDSLVNLSPEELAQREREIFGDHYWRQQQQPNSQYEAEFPPLQAETQIRDVFPPLQPETPILDSVNPPMMQDESPCLVADARIPSFIPPECPMSNRRPVGQYVRDLVLWRNFKDSAVIFTMGGFLLFSLAYFSFISVMAYSALSVLLLASGVVFGRQLMYALQQKESAHPFERIIQQEVVFSPEYAHQQLDSFLMPLNRGLVRMRNLFLADSLGQTLKLALAMYLMTYVGAWFNLLTLAMILWVSVFSIPPMYVMYKPQIQRFGRMIRDNARAARLRLRGMIRRGTDKLAAKMERVPVVVEEPPKGGSVKVQKVKKVTVEKREKIQ